MSGGTAWPPPLASPLPLPEPVANLDKPGGCRVASGHRPRVERQLPLHGCWFNLETQTRTGSTHPVEMANWRRRLTRGRPREAPADLLRAVDAQLLRQPRRQLELA